MQMPLTWGISLICLTALLGAGAVIWMVVVQMRDRRNAHVVVPVEVAVCIQKENGDIVIRQRRGKSLLGMLVGFLLVFSGGWAIFVYQLSKAAEIELDILCAGSGMLILGALVIWVSGRAFSAPDITIDKTNQTVAFRHGIFKIPQIWSFSAIDGVFKQSRLREQVLLNIAEALIAPQYSSSDSERTIIGLQHKDGQEVRICTASNTASRQVLGMIAEAIGKPVITK